MTAGEGVVRRINLSRAILSFVLVAGAVVSTAVDWNATHLFNPAWHPHARFHDALFLMIVNGISLLGLWLLWRRNAEPMLGVTIATLIALIIWTPFFYISLLIPGTSLYATEDIPVLRIGNVFLPPNVIVAAVLSMLTLAAYALASHASKRT